MARRTVLSLIVAATVLTIGFVLSRNTPPLYAYMFPQSPPPAARPAYRPPPPPRVAPPLDPEWAKRLRDRRAAQLEILEAYAHAQKYPRNADTPGRAPVFIDDEGVACAVGHLMRASGRAALADSISIANNNIYVTAIQDGPAMDWILTSGFTKEECAQIQPTYEHRTMQGLPPEERVRVHLLRTHGRLKAATEESLRVAGERLAFRLEKGPLPEECLREVALVSVAPEPK